MHSFYTPIVLLVLAMLAGAGSALAQSCPPHSHSTGGGHCMCDSGYAAKDGACVPR